MVLVPLIAPNRIEITSATIFCLPMAVVRFPFQHLHLPLHQTAIALIPLKSWGLENSPRNLWWLSWARSCQKHSGSLKLHHQGECSAKRAAKKGYLRCVTLSHSTCWTRCASRCGLLLLALSRTYSKRLLSQISLSKRVSTRSTAASPDKTKSASMQSRSR